MAQQSKTSKTRSKALKGNQNAKKDGPTADAVVSFRCLPDLKQDWVAKAKAENLNLGQWIIKQLSA
jgi:hypothetical protein